MVKVLLFKKVSRFQLVEFPIKIHINHKTAATFLREKIKLHEQNSPKVKIEKI